MRVHLFTRKLNFSAAQLASRRAAAPGVAFCGREGPASAGDLAAARAAEVNQLGKDSARSMSAIAPIAAELVRRAD
jgi:hypothetical protein